MQEQLQKLSIQNDQLQAQMNENMEAKKVVDAMVAAGQGQWQDGDVRVF